MLLKQLLRILILGQSIKEGVVEWKTKLRVLRDRFIFVYVSLKVQNVFIVMLMRNLSHFFLVEIVQVIDQV